VNDNADHDAEDGQYDADGVVELRVPASSAFVAVLRTVTASLAARCDLTLDEIEDLRIAVDEACALLIPLASASTSANATASVSASASADLTAVFTLGDGQLVVAVKVPARPGEQPNRDGFGWTVLDALASEVAVHEAEDGLTITLTKRREPAHQ
jgi:serine/threonine-protein kinase RsbW